MKKIIPFLLLTLFSIAASAQQNVYEIMDRNDISIDEAKRQADRLFETIGTGRGTGYKHFQRWYYERKFHIDENGFFISAQEEWNKYLQSRPSLEATQTEAASWTELGPSTWVRTTSWNPGTGRLTSMAIHPSNESIIYVSSPGGGIWKTTNAGATWAPLVDNNSTWMSVFSLAIDPANQNIVYAGTSGSNGLIKSTDAGATWSNTGSGPSGTIYKILLHPTSTNIVFACTSVGLYRSVNGGTSWTQVRSGHKEDIEFKPNDLNIMYAVGNTEVIRSTDMGVSWTAIGVAQGITNTGRSMVAVTPANPNYVYIVQASGNLFGRMYKSTDAGLNYMTTVVGNPASGTNFFGYETNGTGTTGQAGYDMALDVSPTNAAEVYIAGIICFKSINEGNSFTAITAWSLPNSIGYNHADVHGLYWINSTLYSLSDGGIFKSLDAGDNWIDISNGLGILQFYRFDNSPTNPNVITGGAQDNGSATRQAAGNWVDWLGADGMEGLVSPTNHLNLWGTSQNGSIYRSTNGGNSYSSLPRPAPGDWVTPLEIHPTNEAILYGGWTGVWKSVNGGSSWTNISSGVINSLVTDLAIAPSAPTTIYASRGATLWVTTDDGANWATRSAPSTINDIAVDPTNPSKIWVACNSITNRILVSNDGGINWTNISSNLPGIVARAIVVDNNTPRNLYVGMNIGVYHQIEGAGIWADYSDNLPMVAINELEIQASSQKIRVATYGRGVWESPLATSSFTFSSPTPVVSPCPAPGALQTTLTATYSPGFTDNIVLTSSVSPTTPVAPVVVFGTNPLTTGNASTTVSITNAAALHAGTYTVTVTGTAGTVVQTRAITFTVNPGAGPVITTPPASQTVCSGANATFTVVATGTYQWQISTPAVPAFTNIGGATAATLNLTGVTAGMSGNQYRVVVSTQCGSTTSAAASLTVNIAPAITANPQSITLCAGGNHTFSVAATGSGLTHQWQVSTAAIPAFTNIPTATSSSYTITGITGAMNGDQYRCVVSGNCPSPATSNAATLTVVTSVAVTSQPANTTVCDGGNASFTIAGSGTGVIYQWQVNTGSGFVNVPAGAPYSGTNAATLTITGATNSMSGYQYRAQLTNATCTTPGVSNAATLTVNTLPAISANPTNATICVGGNNTFNSTASGTGIGYQWQVNTGSGFTDIPTATASSYTVTGATAGMNGNQYRVVVTGTCAPAATSAVATLTVISPVSIAAQVETAREICSGSNTNFNVTASSTQPITYQWQVNTGGGFNNINNGGVYSGANTATLSITNAPISMNGYLYRVQLSNTTCTAPTISGTGILTVRQLPTVGLTATLTSLLPGQTSLLTATPSVSSGGVLTTSWLFNGTAVANPGNTRTVNIEQVGTYRVTIQEAFSGVTCSSQSPELIIDATVSNKLFIFPSPNDGNFTVSYYNNGGNSTSRTINVYDAKGNKAFSKIFPITGPYTLIPINMSNAARGIYFVVVGDAAGRRLAEGKVHVR